jgi:hypothetical protein
MSLSSKAHASFRIGNMFFKSNENWDELEITMIDLCIERSKKIGPT